MDLKTLKLELLERIALIDDELRLLAIKRVLDAPRDYGIPNEKLSVVKDPTGTERTYTSEEVKRILEEDRVHQCSLKHEANDLEISEEELSVLDERRERHLRGATRSYTWEEVEGIMKKDIER